MSAEPDKLLELMTEVADRQRRLEAQLVPAFPEVSFAAAVERYLAWARVHKERSWRVDFYYLARLSRDFGGRRLTAITRADVEAYQTARAQEPKVTGGAGTVSRCHVNHELVCLKGLFSRAIAWGLAAHNPVRGVRLFKLEQLRERALSSGQVEELLRACTGRMARMRPLLILALNTGFRRGELLGLRWADVDWGRRELWARQTKSSRDRAVPLNAPAIDALRAQETPDGAILGCPWVFASRTGERFNEVRVRWLGRVAGIPRLRFHDLRHTFASNYLAAGGALHDLKELLGHASVSTTSRYLHGATHAKRAGLDAVASTYGRALAQKQTDVFDESRNDRRGEQRGAGSGCERVGAKSLG